MPNPDEIIYKIAAKVEPGGFEQGRREIQKTFDEAKSSVDLQGVVTGAAGEVAAMLAQIENQFGADFADHVANGMETALDEMKRKADAPEMAAASERLKENERELHAITRQALTDERNLQRERAAEERAARQREIAARQEALQIARAALNEERQAQKQRHEEKMAQLRREVAQERQDVRDVAEMRKQTQRDYLDAARAREAAERRATQAASERGGGSNLAGGGALGTMGKNLGIGGAGMAAGIGLAIAGQLDSVFNSLMETEGKLQVAEGGLTESLARQVGEWQALAMAASNANDVRALQTKIVKDLSDSYEQLRSIKGETSLFNIRDNIRGLFGMDEASELTRASASRIAVVEKMGEKEKEIAQRQADEMARIQALPAGEQVEALTERLASLRAEQAKLDDSPGGQRHFERLEKEAKAYEQALGDVQSAQERFRKSSEAAQREMFEALSPSDQIASLKKDAVAAAQDLAAGLAAATNSFDVIPASDPAEIRKAIEASQADEATKTQAMEALTRMLSLKRQIASLEDREAERAAKAAQDARDKASAQAAAVASAQRELAIYEAKARGDTDLAAKLEHQKNVADEINRLRRAGLADEQQVATLAERIVSAKDAAAQKQKEIATESERQRKAEEAIKRLQERPKAGDAADESGGRGARHRHEQRADYARQVDSDIAQAGLTGERAELMRRQKLSQYDSAVRDAQGRGGGPARSVDGSGNHGAIGAAPGFDEFGNPVLTPRSPARGAGAGTAAGGAAKGNGNGNGGAAALAGSASDLEGGVQAFAAAAKTISGAGQSMESMAATLSSTMTGLLARMKAAEQGLKAIRDRMHN